MSTTNNSRGCESTARLVEKAKRFVASKQGRRVLEQTAREAVELTDRLEEARRIDPKALLEPVTR